MLQIEALRILRRAVASIGLSISISAWALDPTLSLDQYNHVAWTEREGAPQAVVSIAQHDDSLWLVANGGELYRFDGVAFERIEQLDGTSFKGHPISRLFGLKDGTLLLTFYRGGAAKLKDGHYAALRAFDAYPRVGAIKATPDGILWALAEGRLLRIEGAQAQVIGPDWGMAFQRATGLTVDRDGTLWVGTNDEDGQLYSLKSGEHLFRRAANQIGFDLAATPDGSIWGVDKLGVRVLETRDGKSSIKRISNRPASALLVDRDGSLWFESNDILVHVNDPAEVADSNGARTVEADSMPLREGMSGNLVLASFEDLEGNIWIGTSGGIDRFRTTRFDPVRLPGKPYASAILAGNGGDIWAGNWDQGLLHITGTSVQTIASLKQSQTTTLYRDLAGVIWIGGTVGVWRIDSSGEPVNKGLPSAGAELSGIRAIISVPGRGLLASAISSGDVALLKDDRWTPAGEALHLPSHWTAATLLVDQHRRLWTTSGDQMLMIEGDKTTAVTSQGVGPGVGAIYTLAEAGSRLWIGGAEGIACFDGQRFVKLINAREPAFSRISGILQLANGDLWIHGFTGVWHIPANEVAAGLEDSHRGVTARRFDASDGLRGIVSGGGSGPNIVQSTDGRIWVSTTAGLAWIDPKTISRSTRDQQVQIDQVTADGRVFGPSERGSLPPLNQQLAINYSAVNLTYPEHVRYRYRLEGIDRSWHDAGIRRTALYNTLPPGPYVFRVAASNEDGTWSPASAELHFAIAPAWYQTPWFRVLCALILILAIWLLVQLRARQVGARVRLRLQARQAEREQIARDLHDTLLQSVFGISLRLQDVANRMPSEDPSRILLLSELDRADETMSEARSTILDLRTRLRDDLNFTDSLRVEAERMAGEFAGSFEMTVLGKEHSLLDAPQEEIAKILREALTNAFRHSGASRVDLHIDFRPSELILSVIDDGKGIAPEIVAAGRTGHWGLAGIRERGAKIEASVDISSRDEGGTIVRVKVPAKIVYRKRRSRDTLLSWFRATPRE